MEPKVIELEAMTIGGVGGDFISNLHPNTNARRIIPALWDRFISQRSALPSKDETVTYGVITGCADLNSLHYIAGARIEPGTDLPSGMETVEVVPGRYAVFTHRGSLQDLPATTHNVYREWLPKSGLTMRDAPHLELYDERFDPSSPNSELDILVPVS